MQKLITKYGLAAHLAILAVAPLFLFPFCQERTIAEVLLWLSGLGAIWVLMEPSVLADEMPHDARRRVFRCIVRDPLFWVTLIITVVVGVRALNGGIALQYDAETAVWRMGSAYMPLVPGVVGAAGDLPFAAMVALTVLLQGARHAMGKSSRLSFVLVSSALAGMAAVVTLVGSALGEAHPAACLKNSLASPCFAAMSYGVYFMGGTVALVAAFERKWNRAIPLLSFSIGGSALGLFCCAPAGIVAVFALADLPILCYSFFYAHRVLRSAGEFKCMVVFGLALTLAVVAVMSVFSQKEIAARLAPYLSGDFLPEEFMKLRGVLSGLASQVWKAQPWLGSGLGSFGIDVRLLATEADWAIVPHGQSCVPNGWWQLLAERGIVGAVTVALPVGLLLFSYVRGIVRGIAARDLPHPMCLVGFMALAGVAAGAFVDASFLRPELILAFGAMMAVSGNSFPKEKSTDG